MKQPPANTLILRELMQAHDLSPSDVAEMTGRSYRTVLQWRSCRSQTIPDSMLELLELKIQARSAEMPA